MYVESNNMTKHPARDHRKHTLSRIIKDNKFKIGAELGVEEGVTTCHLLHENKDLHIIAVDNFVTERSKELFDRGGVPKFIKSGRATHYKMSTAEAAKHVEDGSLDFVFIDADHSYEGVKADIKIWDPKVKEGGYVIGHDYDYPKWWGKQVKQAVDEIYGEKVMTAPDHLWYIKK